MSECLYPTLIADGLLSTPAADNCSTLQRQITSELDKYLQEAAGKHERYDNYYDGWHVATNTSSLQQEGNLIEEDDNIGSDEEVNNLIVLESHGQDTGTHYRSPPGHNIQPQDKLETIPEEEEPQTEEKQDIAGQDTVNMYLQLMNTKKNPSTQPLMILQMTQPLLLANQLPLHLSQMTYASQLKR